MLWFKHPSEFSRDEGVSRFFDAAGKNAVTAYGFLMFVLEAVASRMKVIEGDLICSATYSITQWGRITHSHPNRVRKYLKLCKVIGWVQVEFEDGMCKVSVPQMVEWRDEYTRKSGHTPDKVAQSRARTEQRESRQEGALSDHLTAKEPGLKPPPDFWVTGNLQEWAAKNFPSVNIEQETAKFLRHEFATLRNDWDAAWETWIQRGAEYQKRYDGSSSQPSHNEQLLILGKDLGLVQKSDESDAAYLNRVNERNKSRIAKLDS